MNDGLLKNSPPILNTNMYEIMDYWIKNVAPKYFDMKHQNLNRIGMFGYINETLSHIMESSLNENSILLNEFFFKKAVLPSTIYSYASSFAIDDFNAKPAEMMFSLAINENDLLQSAINKDDETYFIIDSDSEITLEGKFIYSLDYDIKISIKKDINNNFVYTAKYITKGYENPLSNIRSESNPYIKMTKIKTASTWYLVLYVTCRQVSKITNNKIINTENILEYISFDIDYSKNLGQLADFSVLYREPNKKEFIQLEKKLIDTESIDKPFCYYQYKDHNRVNISFSTNVRFFKPKFNSELKFIFYNTYGKSGNFKYNGNNVLFNLKSEKYNYQNIIILVSSISDSGNGTDLLTYEQIKDIVSKRAATCNEISTEGDLDLYFSAIKKLSNITFIKKRDDVKSRLYGAYLLMKDFEDNIIPTNSIGLKLNECDFDIIEPSTKRYIFKQGNTLVYKPGERALIKKKNKNSLIPPMFEYVNPFTIIINRSPYMVEYYLNSINRKFNTNFYMINDKSYLNFIINNINIKRNSLHDDYYNISFTAKPSINDIKITFAKYDDAGNFISSNDNVKMVGVIYDDDNRFVDYVFNIDMVDGNDNTRDYEFSAKIKTDDYITQTSFLRITENLININDLKLKQPFINATKLRIGVLCFVKNEIGVNEPKPNNFNVNIERISKAIDINGYTLSNEFRIDENIKFINDLNRMMYSTAKYLPNDYNRELLHHIKEVPVVKKDYLMQHQYGDDFIRNFINNFYIIKDNLNLLTNAFNISIKFYNTYGKSYYFYINEDKDVTLDMVNLSINMRIKLNPNKLVDKILKENIRQFIKQYIEETNGDINLYISNLIQALENNFNEIIFINFKYINSYTSEVQSIEKNFPTPDPYERNRYKEFVPEYLNVNKKYDGENNLAYDVNIEFV